MSILKMPRALLRRKNLDGSQPGFNGQRPGSDGKRRSPKPVAVAALRINVQFRRDFGVLESQKIHNRILNMHRIVLCLHDEGGRRLRRSD